MMNAALKLRRFGWRSGMVALLLVVLLFVSTITVAADSGSINQESFETDGEGVRYATSNSFNDGANDHFQRTDGSDISNVSGAYSNYDGTYFWAAEDTDDNGGDGLKKVSDN